MGCVSILAIVNNAEANIPGDISCPCGRVSLQPHFPSQIKSASELHLPGDKGAISGIMGAPCTQLGGAKASETSAVQDTGEPSPLCHVTTAGLQGPMKAGGLLL